MFEIFRTIKKTTDFSELLSLELCHFSNEIFAAFELNCVISLYGSLKKSLQNHFGYRMAAVMCQVLPDFYKKNFVRKPCSFAYQLRIINLTCLLVNTLLRLTITLFVL